MALRWLVLIALPACFLKPGPPGIGGEAGAGDDAPSTSDGNTGGDANSGDGGPGRANYVFVTSGVITLLTGANSNMNRDRADSLCNQSAINAHLFGHYYAWMSNDTVGGAPDRLRAALARGWITPTNLPVADTVDDIIATPTLMKMAPRIDENGVDPTITDPNLEVATGTNSNGTGDTANSTCPAGSIRVGKPAVLATWTDFGVVPCSLTSLRVYCFGYDFNVRVP